MLDRKTGKTARVFIRIFYIYSWK